MTEAANITEIEEPTEETDGWAPTTTLEPAELAAAGQVDGQDEAAVKSSRARAVDQNVSDSLQLFSPRQPDISFSRRQTRSRSPNGSKRAISSRSGR